jgi:hypothetical protein
MLKYKGFVKKFLIGPLWGEVGLFRVVLRLRGIKIVFNLGPNFCFYKSYMYDPFIFPKTSFSKIRSPLTVTGMALCVDLGPKCQNLFFLV